MVEERSRATRSGHRYAIVRLATKGDLIFVDQVDVETVAKFLAVRAGEASAIAARSDLAALTAILGFLARRGRFDQAKLRSIRDLRPKLRGRRALHARFLTRDEVERLAAGARRRRGSWGPKLEAKRARTELVVRLAVLSGLRAGELARLRWEDVDLERREIKVLGEEQIKTGRERKVPICEELLQVLVRAELDPARRAGHFFANGPGYVGRAGAGDVALAATVKTLRRELTFARQEAGIPDATFHTLRHTRASWWIQAGVPPAKVALWLGHSMEVLLRHYAGLLQGYDPDCEKAPPRRSPSGRLEVSK